MNSLRLGIVVCGMTLMTSMFAPVAQADAWNRKSVITFSAPVEIPGVHLAGWSTLPAGTYVFKILDSQSDRHIVQILSKDEKTVYATIVAIPNYRLQATDETVVTFRERPAGQPEALRAWFYPGRQWGEEFVYPKTKALALAKATNTPVLFTSAELPMEVAEPVKLATEPVVVELKHAPIMAVQPNGEEVQLAQVVTPPPAQQMQEQPAAQSAASEESLPATGSPLFVIGGLGLLSLAAVLMTRNAGRGLS